MRTGFLSRTRLLCFLLLATLAGGASAAEHVDLLIRNGVIYDGRGSEPIRGDVAVKAGRVVAIGTLRDYTADREVNANGLAVAPGFINTLSWAVESLIYDGRGMSDIKQGVTLEIFGEGNSMGPVNDRVREEMLKTQSDIRYDVTWKTLGEYLDFLVKKGVSPNVASFVGATTAREYVVGYDDVAPTPEQLKQIHEKRETGEAGTSRDNRESKSNQE